MDLTLASLAAVVGLVFWQHAGFGGGATPPSPRPTAADCTCRVEVETLPLPPQFLGLAVLGAASVFVAGCCCGLVCASVVLSACTGFRRLSLAALSDPSTRRLALYG